MKLKHLFIALTAMLWSFSLTANAQVAKIGETTYENLQAALEAAAAGTGNVTVEILANVDLTGSDWNPVTVSGPGYPVVTVEGNHKTITGLNDMLFAGTWAGKSGLIIKNLTIDNAAIVNDKDDAKGNVGVGAFIGYPQASATITLENCHLTNSSVKGGHWTGGLIGMAGGYNGNDGPVFMNLTITGCSVTGSTITGKGSVGGIIGHGSCSAWTNVVIEETTVSGNTITSTGSSTVKAGAVMGTIGAAGQSTTVNGETKTGGTTVSATVADNTVTSNGTAITTIYGRQGTETGMLYVAGGSYDNYPVEKNVAYAAPIEGYEIVRNADGTFGVKDFVAPVSGLTGEGTAASPYLINNVEELLWFQAKVDEQAADGSTQYVGKYIKLTADIDLAGINWNPIGSMTGDHGSFKGVFDGDNHTISNLNIEQAGNGLGLFAYTSGNAVIKNLKLNNVTVESTNNSNYVGGVVGNAYASTKIENVHVTGDVLISGRGYIGGIAGHGYVVMDNVSVVANEGGLITSTFWCAGGVLGYAGEGTTNITNAHVEGLTVTSAAGGLGAIVGMAEDNNGTQPISGSNLSAKNVEIKTYVGSYGTSYADYALGYLYGGNETSKLTGDLVVENVTVKTSSGETPTIVDAVATVGEAVYFDFAVAMAYAKAGETVTLLRDITATEVILLGKSLTINGNGHKVTSNATCVFRVTVKDTEVTLNGVNMVSNTAVNYPNDVRGISIDDVTGVQLTLNYCSVDFTHESAHDWSYAVNVVGGSGHVVTVNGGTYEGANVINVRGANQTVSVKGATLTSLYKENSNTENYGACIYVMQNAESSVFAEGNTFNGNNAMAINAGSTPVTESSNTDNTKLFITGEGTEANPYLITHASQLVDFRNSVNAGETTYNAPGVWVALGADIDLAGENWVGIGSAYKDHGFMGNFDGKNFKIKNLTITNPVADSDGYVYAGLFSVTEGTETTHNVIKNLTIENVTITTDGHIASAAIAYPYYTDIADVTVCGNIAIKGGNYTAGALAYTRRCVNASNVTVAGSEGSTITGAQVVGGVISDIQMNGGLKAEYSNFSVSGVSITGTKRVGGISGIIATQTLNGATVENVTLTSGDKCVGIVSGSFGGTCTITDVTYNDVTGANVIIGHTYSEDGTGAAVEAKIGNTYYSTLAEAVKGTGDVVLLTNVTLKEDVAYVSTSRKQVTGKITYTRNLTAYWNPIYLPFAVELSTEDYDVAEFTSAEGNILTLTKIKDATATLNANTAYVIRPKSEAAKAAKTLTIELTNATLEAATVEAQDLYNGFSVKGNYSVLAGSELDDNDRIVSKAGEWAKLAGTSTLKPFRLILTIPATANAIGMRVEGEDVTSIENLGITIEGDVIYDLMGRRVETMTEGGIYIVNGKKIVF